MYCNKDNAISFYYSNEKLVCLVPSPRMYSVNIQGGKPVSVNYITNVCPEFGKQWRPYSDLRGLNQEDYLIFKPDMVIYQLASGQLLAADKEACAKAGTARNAASNQGHKCFKHMVTDLVLMDKLPEKTAEHQLEPFRF